MWLYAVTGDTRYGAACKGILEDIEQAKLDALISVQVVSEVAGVLYRSYGVKDTTGHVDAILSYRMEIVPVTAEVIRVGAKYAKEFSISPYDAIHVATAALSGITTILSADKELNKLSAFERLDPLSYRKAKKSLPLRIPGTTLVEPTHAQTRR